MTGPGWYPSPDGKGQRWWDGHRWTSATQTPPGGRGGSRWGIILATVAMTVLALVVIGAVAGDDSETTVADVPRPLVPDLGSPEARTNSGNIEYPPTADVEMSSCSTDTFGLMLGAGTVTNNSPEASNYIITVAFESEDGSVQLGTAISFVNGLEPGQSAPLDAQSFVEATGQFSCRVSAVERFAS